MKVLLIIMACTNGKGCADIPAVPNWTIAQCEQAATAQAVATRERYRKWRDVTILCVRKA